MMGVLALVHKPHPMHCNIHCTCILFLHPTSFLLFTCTTPPLHAPLTMGSSDMTAGRLLLPVSVWLGGRLRLLASDLDVDDGSIKDKQRYTYKQVPSVYYIHTCNSQGLSERSLSVGELNIFICKFTCTCQLSTHIQINNFNHMHLYFLVQV